MDSNRSFGKVKWFNPSKGFGFIIPSEASSTQQEIFVHQTNIVSATGFRMLTEGQDVSFECRLDTTGRKQAFDVKLRDGSPITNPTTTK